MGLVQPASAALYDYYNPGEPLGGTWQVWSRCPHMGHQEVGQCRVAGMSCGSLGRGRHCWGGEACALTALSPPEHKCSVFYGAPTKSKLLSTLCSADVCQCAEGESRGWGGKPVRLGREAGEAGAYAGSSVLPPPAPPAGKCPRQRRALERGLQDEAGYRMKFACYYPRVHYGQCAPPPAPGSALEPRPVTAGGTNPCSLLLNALVGFQVKVLREDGRAAFRLFETRITQVLHFSMKGTDGPMGLGDRGGRGQGLQPSCPG